MSAVVPDLDALGQIALFRDVPAAQLEKVRALLHRATFPAGTNLFTVEQPGEVAYLILSGTVKIHIEQADGSDVILAILGPGEVVGEMSVVDSLTRSATVETMEESTVLWIARASLWECLQTMPALASNLVRILSRRLRFANQQIQALATLDVYGRVARQVLAFCEEYGQPATKGSVLIPLRLTQSDLAALVGASRVRVNQVLVEYQRRRYLSIDQRLRITVHDRDALAAYCQ